MWVVTYFWLFLFLFSNAFKYNDVTFQGICRSLIFVRYARCLVYNGFAFFMIKYEFVECFVVVFECSFVNSMFRGTMF